MKLLDRLKKEGKLDRYLLGGHVYFRMVDHEAEEPDCATMMELYSGQPSMKMLPDGTLAPEVFGLKRVQLDDEVDEDEKIFGMTEQAWTKACSTNLLNETLRSNNEDNETKRE